MFGDMIGLPDKLRALAPATSSEGPSGTPLEDFSSDAKPPAADPLAHIIEESQIPTTPPPRLSTVMPLPVYTDLLNHPDYSSEMALPLFTSGKFTYSNGDIYEGEFRGNKPHGTGKKLYADGSSYTGQWKSGRRHGTGVMIWLDDRTYDGQWLYDRPNGTGTMTWVNGDSYSGLWEGGHRQGEGVMTWSSGKSYSGGWQKGHLNARGIMKYPDGREFDGYWLEGQPHGSGTMKTSNGQIHTGIWQNGKLISHTVPRTSRRHPDARDENLLADLEQEFFDRTGFDDGKCSLL